MEKIHHTITLVYSAKDEEHNNAVVLLELLEKPTKLVMGVSSTSWIDKIIKDSLIFLMVILYE